MTKKNVLKSIWNVAKIEVPIASFILFIAMSAMVYSLVQKGNVIRDELNSTETISRYDVKIAPGHIVQDNYIESADYMIDCLPDNVKNYILNDRDITIALVDNYMCLDTMSEKYSNGKASESYLKDDVHVMGTTQPWFNKPIIHVYKRSVPGTLIHEIGHAIDYSYVGALSKVSSDSDFIALYEEEKSTFESSLCNVEGYSTSTREEYFAETFQEYILRPDNLQKTAPKTFLFMDDFVKNI